MAHEPIFAHQSDGRLFLVDKRWPEQTTFSRHVVDAADATVVHERYGHLYLRLANARAVYKIVTRTDTELEVVLVYAESPIQPEKKGKAR